MRKVWGTIVLALIWVTQAGAEYEAGQRAWDAGQRDTAIAEWRAGADAGEAKSMLALGRLYREGQGVPQNYVQAHMWFNLAASRGGAEAIAERDALGAKMPPAALVEAQQWALEQQPGRWRDNAGNAEVEVGQTFRDCAGCPEMIVVPAGSYQMGSPASEAGREDEEGPVHGVTIAEPFAVGVYEVTVGEYGRFVAATGHAGGGSCYVWDEQRGKSWRNPGFGQTARHPVVCVSWEDAQAYARWLSGETGQAYRLPSEAEWEYVARAGTRTARYWGESETGQCRYANGADSSSGLDWKVECNDGHARSAPVGRYEANRFGLYDVLGNVFEWTEDCWNESYRGAPSAGQAWERGECSVRVLRGGSWNYFPRFLRSASRGGLTSVNRINLSGFRLARSLP